MDMRMRWSLNSAVWEILVHLLDHKTNDRDMIQIFRITTDFQGLIKYWKISPKKLIFLFLKTAISKHDIFARVSLARINRPIYRSL